jgi:hypothetical protein
MKVTRSEFLSDDALAGAFAGAVARLLSAPFDVCHLFDFIIAFMLSYRKLEGYKNQVPNAVQSNCWSCSACSRYKI